MPTFKSHLAPMLLAAAVVVLVACGTQHAAPTAAASAAPASAAAAPEAAATTCATAIPTVGRPHEGVWATWTREQKIKYMKEAVMPAEAPLFREYSPTRFAELTCRSCHGKGADDGTYKMPNPALPKLRPGHILEMEQTKPKVFRFMSDVVTPRTAALLNMPEWQHKTMSGFGCFGCHTKAEETSKAAL